MTNSNYGLINVNPEFDNTNKEVEELIQYIYYRMKKERENNER